MEEEVARLAQNLRLTEEEEDRLIIPHGIWDGKTERDGYYVVGRLLSQKSYRIEYVRSTLAAIISPLRGMEIMEIGDKRLLFKFNHILDRNRVMEGCPWTFERHLLVLRPVEEDDNPQTVELNWSPFYVHIHGLRLQTKAMADIIGGRIGRIVEDPVKSQRSWGTKMRVRVEMDIRKPLQRFLQCEKQVEEGYVDSNEDKYYGLWLNATVSRGMLRRFSGDKSQSSIPSLDNLSELMHAKCGSGSRRGIRIFEPTRSNTDITNPMSHDFLGTDKRSTATETQEYLGEEGTSVKCGQGIADNLGQPKLSELLSRPLS
ncbi:UNVERIFIED_CONTAM: hypothetical protein Slati_3678800 [Sesamum latifolium]|uniref:DUF4283 domain-containing protein n=1 Tax=Sesamum latifolium TaxID=2727402 RepID=A0AAW2U5K3_9LAMI